MAITQKLKFNKKQLKQFARLFKTARKQANMSQLTVAYAAFGYEISHCKVSRIERAVMPTVDAHCIERLAVALSVPRSSLVAIDACFKDRAIVAREATRRGFWDKKARSTSTKLV